MSLGDIATWTSTKSYLLIARLFFYKRLPLKARKGTSYLTGNIRRPGIIPTRFLTGDGSNNGTVTYLEWRPLFKDLGEELF